MGADVVAQWKESVLAYWTELCSLNGRRCGGSMGADVVAQWKEPVVAQWKELWSLNGK